MSFENTVVPHLVPIELPICSDDERIKSGQLYLVKYEGRWAVDSFSRRGNDWVFNGFYSAGVKVQADYDGWQACCEFYEEETSALDALDESDALDLLGELENSDEPEEFKKFEEPKKSMGKDMKDDVFGCEVIVNGSTYYLSPLDKSMSPEPDFIRGFRLEKQDTKRPGVYDVIQTQRGFECDCRDYQIRRAGPNSPGCKHLRAMFFFGFLERVVRKSAAPVETPDLSPRPRTNAKNVFPL